ncbi:4,5-DOPA dioxygenase extradiol [Novosphingobium aquae]|uniref:4,5-DOPA dioxygenase extradiol n=1 Tax=Novosphingobium aquae TaxID=3133435 RepID=A0ABU8S6F5_9SPHN
MTTRMPALFLGHGSPMTVITDNPYRASFVALGKVLPRPKAILAISAHWETQDGRVHLTAGAAPRTIHDFRGFPPELFAMQYPAPGSDDLVDRVAALLGEERIVRDESWGFDHGTWGVLQPMYPATDIPTVQLGLDRPLDAVAHIEIGRALAPLRDEGVLIVGSGNVVHNLSLWRQSQGTQPEWALDIGRRVVAAAQAGDDAALAYFAPDDRAAAMAINSAEHYLPLLYVIGARLPGDEVAVFNDDVDGALSMTSFLVGDPGLLEGIA